MHPLLRGAFVVALSTCAAASPAVPETTLPAPGVCVSGPVDVALRPGRELAPARRDDRRYPGRRLLHAARHRAALPGPVERPQP